jgi:hypothetical protein
MAGNGEDRIAQRARGRRDVYQAGRDINNYYDSGEPVLPGPVAAGRARLHWPGRRARLAGGGRVVVSAIGGTAGVGKTALAVHSAHQLLGQFPDGHLYADLRGTSAAPTGSCGGLGRQLNPGGRRRWPCAMLVNRTKPNVWSTWLGYPVPVPPPLGPAPQVVFLISRGRKPGGTPPDASPVVRHLLLATIRLSRRHAGDGALASKLLVALA